MSPSIKARSARFRSGPFLSMFRLLGMGLIGLAWRRRKAA
jgi:hypothetical protein